MAESPDHPDDVVGVAPGRTWTALWLLPPLFFVTALAASWLALPHLPDRMPTRWDFEGQPINLMQRGPAVFMLPGIMVWIGFLTSVLGWSAGQTREGRDMPAWLSPAITSLTLGFMLLLHLTFLAAALGWGVPLPLIINLAVGIFFVGLGWAMPRVPPNPLFGVRTARTLSCPDTWAHANRIGGRYMVGAGTATILAAPLPGPWPFVTMMAAILIACIGSLRAARGLSGKT